MVLPLSYEEQIGLENSSRVLRAAIDSLEEYPSTHEYLLVGEKS
jgi:hypothetical protein